jgi:hypothetical protein
LTGLQSADVVRREIVKERRSVVARQFDLRAVAEVDQTGAGCQSGVFRSGRIVHRY